MKKIIYFLITLLLVGLVSAIPSPHPVFGTILDDGVPVQGLEVKVRNDITGASGITTTDNSGRYQVDLGNIDERWNDGDIVRVSLVYCEALSRCVVTKTIEGGNTKVEFDVTRASLPTLPPTVTVGNIVCWNGVIVANARDCPVQVIPDPVVINTIICADGTEVDDETECPEEQADWVKWVLGILLAFFAGAGFWRIGGKYGLMHYHRGIKGYHNPMTKHRVYKYRHIPFWLNPVKAVRQIKAIESGDLPEE